jgi:hypothetical protein
MVSKSSGEQEASVQADYLTLRYAHNKRCAITHTDVGAKLKAIRPAAIIFVYSSRWPDHSLLFFPETFERGITVP